MRVNIIKPTVKEQKEKKRVCAYARVSSVQDKQGESLENQIQYYEKLIANNLEYEYIGVFADKGITGTTKNRPEFQRMLELCREGKIDLIITKSISRFARNTTIILETVRELKDLGVEIIFEKENIRTLSGDGELMLTVLSSFAQEESKNVSDNVKWRIKKEFERGIYHLNTNRFLGYDKDEFDNLVINRKEAKIVERIFEDYLKGKGTFVIAKELNIEEIPTVTGVKWWSNTIFMILKNEKYKGDIILQKYYTPDHLKKKHIINNGAVDRYYIEDNHPPIVSREVWDNVQSEIKRRGISKRPKEHPLLGMLYCSKCGAVLSRRLWSNKTPFKKYVWQCSNYVNKSKRTCTGTKIDEKELEKVNIDGPIIIREEFRDGKKHYTYTSKR